MITLNTTLLMELALFLIFLWISNKIVVRPLLKTIDARNDKIEQDKQFAETQRQEAKRLDSTYVEQLTRAHQEAAHRFHQARLEAYSKGRAVLDAQRAKAEDEIAAFRAAVDAQADVERRKFEEVLPTLVELADLKVNTEGSLL